MPLPKEIRVGDGRLVIPAAALEWQFVRSSGPGGQHVNRTSSKAVLHFDPGRCPGLDAGARQRLAARNAGRTAADGVLVITSQVHREQPRNVAACVAKLSALVAAALVTPRRRRPTRVPRSAVAQRLEQKRRTGMKKSLRRGSDE
ncbi:MAG: aminoacyl-tRNA hydrolase [Planctomycetia bacterium]|nr:aminoacyl-tRNA hydrolase [Planctomycetia bacterium]